MLDNLNILIAAPGITLQLVINGILIGAIFALAAYGMALVWGVTNIINIAQGEFVMLGGFVAVTVHQAHWHPLLAVPAAAVVLYALGWLLYRTVIFRIVDRDLFTSLLATFGISIVLQQLMNTVFGGEVQVADAGLDSWFLLDGLVAVSQVKVLAFILTLVLGATLAVFLKRSRLGQAIRATAQHARAARLLGVDTDRVYAATFGLNAALCGAAGALVADRKSVV